MEAKEHQKLMKEHLDVTKDLLNAKNSQVVETLYQWAAAKAKLHCSARSRGAGRYYVLKHLVTKLKLKVVKTAPRFEVVKRLTKKQTTRFYSLGQLLFSKYNIRQMILPREIKSAIPRHQSYGKDGNIFLKY